MVAEGQTAIAGETVLADLQAADARADISRQLRPLTQRPAPHGGRVAKPLILLIWPCIVPILNANRLRRRRFRRIPVRTLVPNVITLLALCAGLTAIRMAFEERNELALAAIVFAAVLDGIDGRVARLLKGTSRFGAELDSLADFVNFGVAPALILYFWGLHDLKSAGWIAAMVFAICAGPAARALQRDDRRSRTARLGRQFLRRHAGAGRRDHRAAADLCGLPRRCRIRAPQLADAALHACHRLPDGVAAAGVFRQARRQARAAGNGAAGGRRGAVLRAADRLSVGGAHIGHPALSRQPAVRLAVLSRARAQDGRPSHRTTNLAAEATMPAPPWRQV